VRKGTKSFIGIVSLGLVAAGYQAGQAAEISSGFSAASTPLPVTAASTTPIAVPVTITPIPNLGGSDDGENTTTIVASTAPAPAATTKAPVATPKAPVSTPQATPAAPSPVSTPKASATTPAPAPAPVTASATKTGSAISYRYGTVQVSVTKANGKITAVNLLQQGATGGRQGAFPYLVQYAIQANGSGFGSLGGATYTTDAFKQSLESALAKF
jgi:uncharacterized protein with FMN-binding domain